MMEIVVAAMFRDSQVWHGLRLNQVGAFFANWDQQAAAAGVRLRYVLLEGDSTDDTWAALTAYSQARSDVTLVKWEVGGTPPSSARPELAEGRRAALSTVGNVVLREALWVGSSLVLWAESDLLPEGRALPQLLEMTTDPLWSAALGVAPVPTIHLGGLDAFYDTWAFEGQDGERWGNYDLKSLRGPVGTRYRPMRAVGSCALLNADNLRRHGLDFGSGCFPALCQAGRRLGLQSWCDTAASVRHPSTALVAGRWV